jgi:predicted O-methyltransferase YrrM
LTDTGRGELATADASAVWAEFETSGDDESGPLDDAMRALRSTIGHVQDTADPEARAATVELVESLRRSLYLVLAGERVPSRQSSATQPTSGPADWSAADEAVESVLIPDGRIETAVAASSAAGLPRIQVSSLQGRFLAILARAVAARRILEIGTLGGYSASWLAGTLPADGQLVSLELDPHHAEVALGNLTRVGLADRVDIRVGPAASALDALRVEAADPFDLVFIDADKQANGAYLTAALELARVGGLIVIDNIVRAGRSLGPNATGDGAEGTAEVLTIFATDPRIEGTIVQTVGARGWDGFAIGVVVDPEHAQDDAPRA